MGRGALASDVWLQIGLTLQSTPSKVTSMHTVFLRTSLRSTSAQVMAVATLLSTPPLKRTRQHPMFVAPVQPPSRWQTTIRSGTPNRHCGSRGMLVLASPPQFSRPFSSILFTCLASGSYSITLGPNQYILFGQRLLNSLVLQETRKIGLEAQTESCLCLAVLWGPQS